MNEERGGRGSPEGIPAGRVREGILAPAAAVHTGGVWAGEGDVATAGGERILGQGPSLPVGVLIVGPIGSLIVGWAGF